MYGRGHGRLLIAAAAAAAVAVATLWLAANRLAAPTVDNGELVPFDRFAFLPRAARFDLRAASRFTGPLSYVPWRRLELAEGWSGPQEWGVWGLGGGSRLEVPVLDPGVDRLFLEGMAFPDLRGGRRQTVSVRVNGVDCGCLPVPATMTALWLDLPRGVVRAGRNQVKLHYAYGTSPFEQGVGEDTRPLAVGFRRFGLLAGRGATEQPTDWAPAVQVGPDGGQIEVLRPGLLVVPLQRSGALTRVVFDGSFEGTLRRGLRVEAARLDDERVGRPAGVLAALGRPVEASLPAGSGDGYVAWKVNPGSGTFVLRSVRAVGSSPRWPEPAPPARPTVRPDIVVLILDAARADHVGCYGYDRDTTPTIDRLARSSLVFTQVYAQTPYTLASVPTMLTGQSFVRHGVVSKRRRLKQAPVTLAEHLRAAGYRTLAFSATPHNSCAMGFDQGYEEFHEVWRGVDEATALDPFYLSRLVVKRIRAGLGEQPLHLMVHYVPPHAPYAPRPDYDLFGDPDYDGSVDGRQATLTALVSSGLVPPQEDIVELVSLYDGNLRMADAAVGMVLDALEQAGHSENAVVAVVADHGEAFFEHGQQGHNTSLYGEMLHVPLILRLPADLRPPAVDRDRLASLADLTPTLLGLAGLPAEPTAAGVDLLRHTPDAPAPPDRFVMRTATDPVIIYGLRSGRWKAIFGNDGLIQQLFDLAGDPGETRNVAVDHPEVMAALDQLLAKVLATGLRSKPTERGNPVSGEEHNMLRALGYVE